jgi:hypothetical protein
VADLVRVAVVRVRGVDEGDAGIECGVDRGDRAVRAGAAFDRHGHAAEADRRYGPITDGALLHLHVPS